MKTSQLHTHTHTHPHTHTHTHTHILTPTHIPIMYDAVLVRVIQLPTYKRPREKEGEKRRRRRRGGGGGGRITVRVHHSVTDLKLSREMLSSGRWFHANSTAI